MTPPTVTAQCLVRRGVRGTDEDPCSPRRSEICAQEDEDRRTGEVDLASNRLRLFHRAAAAALKKRLEFETWLTARVSLQLLCEALVRISSTRAGPQGLFFS